MSLAVADDDQALEERLVKREERRQKRMQEAIERQKELDPSFAAANGLDESPEARADDDDAGRRPRDAKEEEEDEGEAEQQVQEDVLDATPWKKEEEVGSRHQLCIYASLQIVALNSCL